VRGLGAIQVMELVRSLRVGRMQELLLLGRALSAEEMVQWDLASVLVREADAADAGKQVWNAAVAAYGYPPRLRQLRRRLREMAQCDWPKNLLTIKQDKRDAGCVRRSHHPHNGVRRALEHSLFGAGAAMPLAELCIRFYLARFAS
jgi:enoyl-CoA hydratase/carnithine racemase